MNNFSFFKKVKDENLIIKFSLLLIAILPAIILTRSAIINITLILFSFITSYAIINNKKNLFIFKNNFFFLILLFYLSIFLNIFLSENNGFIFERQIGLLRFLILVFGVYIFLSYKNFYYFKYILKIWFIIFLIVNLDILYELIFTHNITGNKSLIAGRVSSFLGDELKVGNYYNGFVMLSLAFIILNFKKTKIFFFFIFLFLIIAFLIGERANFIKTLLGIFIYFVLTNKISIKRKIIIFLSILILVTSSIFSFSLTDKKNGILGVRYIHQIVGPIKKEGFIKTVLSSHYGVHYYTAFQIFKNYPVFGIGLKQYRIKSLDAKYEDNIYNIYGMNRWATHPHQIHFEFLSETGLFGYSFFLIFLLSSVYLALKRYIENKNEYLLASTIFLITSFIPLIPSGSFFTTYTAAIFWINYSVLITTYNIKKPK